MATGGGRSGDGERLPARQVRGDGGAVPSVREPRWQRRGGLHAAGGLGQAHALERRPRVWRTAAGAGDYETGLGRADDGNIAPTNANLGVRRDPAAPTRRGRTRPGSQENLPINCVNWCEAYAFCIWDGGFLPSEAEWEYAAAGGSQQRSIRGGRRRRGRRTSTRSTACYYPSGSRDLHGVANIAPVGTATLGAGPGASSIWRATCRQWNLDWYCYLRRIRAPIAPIRQRLPTVSIGKGGTWDTPNVSLLLPTVRYSSAPTTRSV